MKHVSAFKPGFDVGAILQRQVAIGAILAVALLAFELFNFDTTQYALGNLLGNVAFFSVPWATILAIAFCAIDFAGLVRFFSPGSDASAPREVWYLMGAWLLGATMNALMTWWAVSLTLINHQFGNEVLSRAELLRIVPIFVAVLVWLTRILFIGGLTLAGGRFWNLAGARSAAASQRALPRQQSTRETHQQILQHGRRLEPARRPAPADSVAPNRPEVDRAAGEEARRGETDRASRRPQQAPRPGQSVRQRPPMPPVGQRLPLKAGGRRNA